MSTIPTVNQPNANPRADGWALPDESVRRPALVVPSLAPARPTMDEIDDGWFLPEEAAVSAPAPAAPAPSGKVDLNRATFEQLQALPGVGRLRARRILDLRDKQGGFRAIEDLSAVRGIGKKTLVQLADLVAVD